MRYILNTLLAFTGFTAGLSGLQMAIFPDGSGLGLPVTLLGPTPFNTFFIPGIVLALVVGGSSLVALFFRLAHNPFWYFWTMLAGLVLCGWIIGQMILIQTANWLHFAYMIAGLLIIIIAGQQKKQLTHR